jgi:predicted DNA-binding transcriptional regulator AlpA
LRTIQKVIYFYGVEMKEIPLLVYPQKAQEILGVGTTKFYELVKLPSFPKPRSPLGKRVMYLREEIESWARNLAYNLDKEKG